MPYTPHPSFGTPSRDRRIWRYMSLAKFISLLDTKALFFARSDRFRDPFEGSYPIANRQLRAMEAEALRQRGMPEAVAKLTQEGNPEFKRNFRRFVAISCWHMSDDESAALWDKYAPTGEGVAIESSVGGLIDALTGSPEIVFVGAVRYIDYKTEAIREGNLYNPFLHKRRSFTHEKELRAIATRHPTLPEGEQFDPVKFWAQETMTDGVSVDLDVAKLVHGVWVAPTSPEWFLSTVKAVGRKYDLPTEIFKRSDLAGDPDF